MDDKSVVSIVKTAPQPSEAAVEEAVYRAVALAGGMEDIIKPGHTVIVKPNLVCDPIAPDGSIFGGCCTRVEVSRAVARLVKERGATPIIAESATVGLDTEAAILRMGYDRLRDEGFQVIDLKKGQKEVRVECPQGKIFKHMTTWEIVAKADGIISVPVMKTHGQTVVTLGIKNLKGIYTDAMKKRAHVRQLFQQVADWATVVKPCLTVIDGIVGQEGDGPVYGMPIEMDLIIAGKDPVATDAVATAVMGFDPDDVQITRLAAEHGLGTMDLSEIKVRGEPIEKVKRRFVRVLEDNRVAVPDFRVLHSEDTCTGCRLSFHNALIEMTQAGFVERLAGYAVLTGAGQIPPDVDLSRLVTIGRCVPKRNQIGKAHVPGCPPNNLPQMRAFLGGDPEFDEFARKRGGLDF